jgi:endonuclease YncB( thermonuclease family)
MRSLVFVLVGVVVLTALAPLLHKPASAGDKPATAKAVVSNNARGEEYDRIRGKVTLVSGKALRFADGTEIDLNIDYPKPDTEGSKGAVEFLKKLIGDQEVTCFQAAGLPLRGEESRWGAYVGDTNVQHAIVINGWAIAGHTGTRAAEMIAREKKRGLWADK